jgi:hypothetical protein
MKMAYWDGILRFHKNVSKGYSSGEEGLRAVRFLKHFFEKLGCAGFSRDHPLNNRLSVGIEQNYQWLIQYARKLYTASSLSGFEDIASRLTDHRTFLDANNEIEVALKFHLAELDVSFVPIDYTHQTPDILLKINKLEYHVEVSSLNPPDQEALMWMFHAQLTPLTSFKGLISGGLINRIPNKNKLIEIIEQVKEKTEQIKETNESVKLSFPGCATIYIAPRDKMSEIPKGSRGIYRLATSPRRSIEERIQRKISGKYDQLFSLDKPVFLFLYTQTIDAKMLHEYFNKVVENVEVILASYPALLGLVLTVPHLRMDVVSSISSDSLKREINNNKVFLESEVGKYQYESSLIWKNLHADQTFPSEILSAMENLSSNSQKLAQLPSH